MKSSASEPGLTPPTADCMKLFAMLCDSGTALFCVNVCEGCQDSRCLSNWTSFYESLENIRFVIRIASSPQTKSQDVDYFFKTTLSVTHRQTLSKGGEWWNETHCCKLHANRRNNSQNSWAINVVVVVVVFPRRTPSQSFWYVAVFRSNFAFSKTPLIFSTIWGILKSFKFIYWTS